MYYVYIITNKNKTVLYTGLTGDLAQRIAQYKAGEIKGFTQKYNLDTLIYYEEFQDVLEAKAREKAIKKWNRSWKGELIGKSNPEWDEVIIM